MIAVGQRQKAPLCRPAAIAPVVIGHLDGYFDGCRAVVGQKAAVEPGWCYGGERFGQFDGRFMREAREDHMLQLPDLLNQRRVESRVGMAEQVDPPGTDRVQVPIAVEVLQPHAFAAAYRDHRQIRLVILHLRAGVPDVGQVATRQGGVG